MVKKNSWLETVIKFEATAINIESSFAKGFSMSKRISIRTKHIDLKYHFVKATIGSVIVLLYDFS